MHVYQKKLVSLHSLLRHDVTNHKQSGCSAVGSALRSGRRCRQFESGHPDIKGARKNNISPYAFSFKYNPTLKAIEEDIIKVQTSDSLSLHRAHYTR